MKEKREKEGDNQWEKSEMWDNEAKRQYVSVQTNKLQFKTAEILQILTQKQTDECLTKERKSLTDLFLLIFILAL